jgi:hypothetical protein
MFLFLFSALFYHFLELITTEIFLRKKARYFIRLILSSLLSSLQNAVPNNHKAFGEPRSAAPAQLSLSVVSDYSPDRMKFGGEYHLSHLRRAAACLPHSPVLSIGLSR